MILFLGFSPERTGIKPNIDDKIQQLQKEIEEIDGNTFTRTN